MALKTALEINKNYEVTIGYVSDATVDVTKHDFVVLHNLPSASFNAENILNKLNEKQIQRLFIAGMQTNFNTLAKAQALVNVPKQQPER